MRRKTVLISLLVILVGIVLLVPSKPTTIFVSAEKGNLKQQTLRQPLYVHLLFTENKIIRLIEKLGHLCETEDLPPFTVHGANFSEDASSITLDLGNLPTIMKKQNEHILIGAIAHTIYENFPKVNQIQFIKDGTIVYSLGGYYPTLSTRDEPVGKCFFGSLNVVATEKSPISIANTTDILNANEVSFRAKDFYVEYVFDRKVTIEEFAEMFSIEPSLPVSLTTHYPNKVRVTTCEWQYDDKATMELNYPLELCGSSTHRVVVSRAPLIEETQEQLHDRLGNLAGIEHALCFVDENDNLNILDLRSLKRDVLITDEYILRFEPNPQKAFLACFSGLTRDVFLYDIEDKSRLTLEEDCCGFEWSPNGRYLMIDSGSDVWRSTSVYDVTNDQLSHFRTATMGCRWSPDGNLLALAIPEEVNPPLRLHDGSSITAGYVDVSNINGFKVLFKGTRQAMYTPAVWLDQSTLVVHERNPDEWGNPPSNLAIDIETKKVRVITEEIVKNAYVTSYSHKNHQAISSDGKYALTIKQDSAPKQSSWIVLHIKETGEDIYLFKGRNPRWLP